ncbi:MAG: hypothetical protein ACREM3_23620 [Candidatus Rokuibacteriota bacterium]
MTTTATPVPFSVHALRSLQGGKDLFLQCSAGRALPEQVIAVVAGAAIELLATADLSSPKPDLWVLAGELWEKVRGLEVAGRTVEASMQDAMMPTATFVDLLRVLHAAGDVFRSLVEQRASIDRTLEHLAGLRAVAVAGAAKIKTAR